jgi:hypothetical protein
VRRALGGLEGLNGGFDLRAEGVDRFAQVVGELYSQPIARRQPKIGGKVKIGLRRDSTLFVNDFIDPLLREFRLFRETVGGEAHGPQKLFPEQFARVDVEVLFHGSVIVGDFYFVGIEAIPPEAHPILVVYPDAVLTSPVPLKRLEAVARGKAQIVETGGGFKLGEFPEGDFVEGRWKFRGPVAAPQGFGRFMGERMDHGSGRPIGRDELHHVTRV